MKGSQRNSLPGTRSRLRVNDLLDEVALSLCHRPARSLLTALGTVLGVATLVCTVGLTATASAQVSARFDALQATKVVIKDLQPEAAEPAFPPQSLERLRRTPGVEAVGESWTLPVELPVRTVDRDDPSRPAPRLTVVAVDPEALKAFGAVLGAGRTLDSFEVHRSEPVVLLGQGAATSLGLARFTAGQVITVGSMRVLVGGVVTEAPRRPELLSAVLVVPGTAKTLLAGEGTQVAPPPHEVTVKVRLGAAQVIGRAAPLLLGPHRPVRYQVEVPPSPDEFRAQVQGDLGSVFLVLGAVALIVGVLGIANSGLVAVMQRTREFGVRRALGARARHVAAQVLCEAAVLGLAGGLAGLTLGLTVILATAANRNWAPVLDPTVMVAAPAVGLAVGVLAGLYPAWRASRIEPVEALRG